MAAEVTEKWDSPISPTEVTYIQVKTLGRGAFGEAILYRRVEDNTFVVWKEIAVNRLSAKESNESDNEVEILSLLDHPNIITYYNHFLDAGTLLIEMEYANGGDLWSLIAQYAEKGKLMLEERVVWYFYQLMSAVDCIHGFGIIHRDIKSLNIFLTKSGLCKVGDFGISKIMNTSTQMAQSVVGTPYYMSPELIKGEEYNYKSDIWACGCVLYELLTLERVFQATNALRLAAVIVQEDVKPINAQYTKEMHDLLALILNKDPGLRPDAQEILSHAGLTSYADGIEKKVWKLNTAVRNARHSSMASLESHPIVKSQSSEVYIWGGGKTIPRKLDMFHGATSASQSACSKNHYAVLTNEKELYTWTNTHGQSQMNGQLGHGGIASYKNPKKVQHFDGVPIRQVVCGDEFTACITDDGILYTFGSDYYGSLGQPEVEQILLPSPVPFFTEKPVAQIACGTHHMVALTTTGEVYTWGCGEYGRLGLGDEDDRMEPERVMLPAHLKIHSVHAGTDCTFLITHNGKLLVAGSNDHNKLGIMNKVEGIAKRQAKVCYDVQCLTTFKLVKPLRQHRLVLISSGTGHSAAVTDYGQLLTFGNNKFGQLGLGDFREHRGINIVSGTLAGQQVKNVSCGDNFTVIGTCDNQIFSCGSYKDGRLGIPDCNQNIAHPRPIFGSLHVIGNVNSSGWGTILVADRVISQKTIRQTSAGSSRSASSAECQESCSPRSDASSASSSSNQAISTMLATTTPAWLKQVFAESPVEPPGMQQPPKFPSLKLNLEFNNNNSDVDSCGGPKGNGATNGEKSTSSMDANNNPGSAGSLAELNEAVKSLHSRIESLESENAKLKQKNIKQDRVIDKLINRLERYDPSFRQHYQKNLDFSATSGSSK